MRYIEDHQEHFNDWCLRTSVDIYFIKCPQVNTTKKLMDRLHFPHL